MNRQRQRGFTLVEFVVAIVFIAVVLGPLLLFVARLHDLNSAIGQQGRREAWRSFNDQAVLAGIDPSHAPALAATGNPSIPSVPMPAVSSAEVTATPGVARIVPLRVVLDTRVAEPRMAGAGYQIGAGANVSPRSTPVAPLAPIVMPMPVVTPPDGTVIAANTLTPASPGAPYTTSIQAASSSGTKVFLSFNQPYGLAQGFTSVQQGVSAVDLMNRVNGAAWTEYPGATNDRSATLGDGRTRWFVTRDDGRLQIYEPSPAVSFAYQVGLGSPVIVHGVDELPSGSTLSFDYAAYYEVQAGRTTLRIDFPAAVKSVFGTTWGAQSIGFQCAFHDSAGPFSGDLSSFFTTETLALWSDAVPLAATAVLPPGATADQGTWTFSRNKVPLGVPVMASVADASGFYAAGQLQFTAPNGPDGSPIGRLSFDNGSTLSTGPTLAIAVIP